MYVWQKILVIKFSKKLPENAMLLIWRACLPWIDALVCQLQLRNHCQRDSVPKGDTYIYCTSLFDPCWYILVACSHVHRSRRVRLLQRTRPLFPQLGRHTWKGVGPLGVCLSTESPESNFPSLLILTFPVIDYSWSSPWAYSFQVKRWRSRSYGCIDDMDSSSTRFYKLDNQERD